MKGKKPHHTYERIDHGSGIRATIRDDDPDYYSIYDENGEQIAVIAGPERIAKYEVEEAEINGYKFSYKKISKEEGLKHFKNSRYPNKLERELMALLLNPVDKDVVKKIEQITRQIEKGSRRNL
ncbi:hypothetical protein HY212_05190 [Candidatus Pacearchaeota archaeon]|nr:hypothetical protein [Candidatus Pacearchaeota archaeon]